MWVSHDGERYTSAESSRTVTLPLSTTYAKPDHVGVHKLSLPIQKHKQVIIVQKENFGFYGLQSEGKSRCLHFLMHQQVFNNKLCNL